MGTVASPWSDEEAEQARGILTQGNGAEELCAVMGCEPEELDALCRDAFGLDFEEARKAFDAQGRALIRRMIWQQAQDGNAKAVDMLARERLGMGPVETRRRAKTQEREEARPDGAEQQPSGLKLLQGKRADRRARATG